MKAKEENLPSENTISKTPFPGSNKIYVKGELHDISVAMREIKLTPTKFNGKEIENPSVTVYDTSGPFTDPSIDIDVKKGLPKIREKWILERGDVEQLDGMTSAYGNERLKDKGLDALRFVKIEKPLRAKKGANVSQMYYAKKGIITPEMEYVAIRENQKIEQVKNKGVEHPGKDPNRVQQRTDGRQENLAR